MCSPALEKKGTTLLQLFQKMGLSSIMAYLLGKRDIHFGYSNQLLISQLSTSPRYNQVIYNLLQHPQVDPAGNDFKVLKNCIETGNIDLLGILIQDYRIYPALKANNRFLVHSIRIANKQTVGLLVDKILNLLNTAKINPSLYPSIMQVLRIYNPSLHPRDFIFTSEFSSILKMAIINRDSTLSLFEGVTLCKGPDNCLFRSKKNTVEAIQDNILLETFVHLCRCGFILERLTK